MKVIFISADNLYLTPYLRLYTDILDANNDEYDVLYWDKRQNEPSSRKNYHRFIEGKKAEKATVFGYIKFRNWILKKLKMLAPDFLICLHQVANLILADVLLFRFSGKYIYDVRDYSYERFLIVRIVQRIFVRKSAMNIISSEGYRNFLPQGEYYIAHNLPAGFTKNCQKKSFGANNPIRISYIGLIRFMEQNKKIIRFFCNDERFILYFIGTGAEQLKEYCESIGAKNIVLIGTFDPQDTLQYYENTDLIMNLYGNKTPLLDFALSNKLYYAAMVSKPILVCDGTYMEQITHKFGFGYTLTLSEDQERDELFSYICSVNHEEIYESCNKFLVEVTDQQEKLLQRLKFVLSNVKK